MNRPSRILQVHNEYFSGRGGEDTVVSLELAMLRKNGHEVEQLIVSTAELQDANSLKILAAGISTPWSIRGYRLVQRAIERYRPQIVHFHNTFPLLSPSVYWAAHSAGVPVVQTLHNYRSVCANGLISRADAPCEDCIGHLPIPALRYRCYKDSFFATAPIVAMQMAHRTLGTMQTKVDSYIALTTFAKEKMVQAGFPREKIHVKPNFVPGAIHAQRVRAAHNRQFVFAGSIIRHKGLDLLLEAWSRLDSSNGRLVVIGEGSCRADLQRQYPNSDRLVWLGWQNHESTLASIGQSDFLVIPSRVVEGLSMVLVEALSVGTPTIGPNHGAFPELISDSNDGLLFQPREVDSLVLALKRALSIDDAAWMRLSDRCLSKYRDCYTEDVNYLILREIYSQTIDSTPARGLARDSSRDKP